MLASIVFVSLLVNFIDFSEQKWDRTSGYMNIDRRKSMKVSISSPFENLVFRNAKTYGGLWMDWAEHDSIYLNGQGFGSENSFEFSIVPVDKPMNATFEVYSEGRNAKVLTGKYTVSKTGAVNFKLEGFDEKIKCSRDTKLKNVWHYLVDMEQNEKESRRTYITCQ